MKKILLIIYCFLLVDPMANIINAQNTLVYFRYDIVPNDIGKVIALIDSVRERTEGRFVLYYENQSYEDNKYEDLVSSKDFLRYTSIYEPENEETHFSQFSSSLLNETVTETHLSGKNDKQWKYIFILSDAAQKQELIKLILVNSLQKRLRAIQFIIYDEMSQVHKESFVQLVDNNNTIILEY